MYSMRKTIRVGVAALLASSMMVGVARAQDSGPESDTTTQAELDAAQDDAAGNGAEADEAPPSDGSNEPVDAALEADVESAALAAESAAAANDEVEWAVMDALPVPDGDPIIPQQTPDRPDIADGSEPDPLATTAPAPLETDDAAAVADEATAPVLNEPVAGTSTVVTFDDAAESDAALTPQLEYQLDTSGRSRVVQLDGAALESALDAEAVEIELFSGVTAQLETSVAPTDGALDSEWSAAGTSGEDLSVVTVLDGAVLGQFWVGESQYGLQSIDGSTALIYEYDRDVSEDGDDIHDGPDVNGPSGLTAQELGREADIIGAPAIEILIAYDTEAAAFYGNTNSVRLNAAHMVNLTNAMFRTSNSELHMNLTGIYATGSAPSNNSMNTYLDELTSKTDGRFDAVHTRRDSDGADLIALLSDRFWPFGSFGLAWLPGGSNSAENRAYSVSEVREAIDGLTFPHEIAHNLCAGHDASPRCGYTDNTGHITPAVGRKTVMARRSQCRSCTREPVYSNPSVQYKGWTTGVTNVSDNHRVMEIEDLGGVSGGVANYRTGNGLATSVAGIDGKSCIYGSLEQAFTNAPTGSTIYVAPGTYVGQDPVFNFNISRSMDVEQGTAQCQPTTSGAATNVVLQPAPGSNNDSVLEIRAADVRIERITIENGVSAEGNVEVENNGTAVLDGTIIRNGNNPSNGGGLRIASSNNSAEMINNGQIVNNTAVNGGGVYVNGGTFTINDTDDVEDNSASDGGGVYATGNAKVTVSNDGDVNNNTATADGGGVHLTGGADLTVFDSSSHIGFGSQGNEALRGGGVFIDEGSTGSKVTIRDRGQVEGNSANFGAGVYLLNGELEVNDGGDIINNTGGNGGGILAVNNPDTSTIIDLNPGARVIGNTGALGAGIYMSTKTTLRTDGGVDSGSVNPVLIQNNASTSDGGGLYLSGAKKAIVDTTHFVGNSAVRGGGIFATSNVDVIEGNACDRADLAKEQFCSEFDGNSATNGGAIYANGSDVAVFQTGFIANTATTGAQAVESVGDADVDVEAAMILDHNSCPTGDGSFTAKGTSTLDVTAATIVSTTSPQCAWYDLDDSGSGSVSRIIATTNVLGTVTNGNCNLQTGSGFGHPDAVTANPGFVATANSDFVPNAASPAVDACKSQGSTVDILDQAVINGDGLPSGTEFDMGAIEAPRGHGFTCFGKKATIVGDSGNNKITGTGGRDVIVTLAGNDTVNAGGGHDRICLGRGNDTANGQGGNDRVDGGSGTDRMNYKGSPRGVTANLGTGSATGWGADVLVSIENLNGSSKSDKLTGNGRRNVLRGKGGADIVNGKGARDILRGDGGADRVLGGSGRDNLRGGRGAPDRCNGQSGADTGGQGCEIRISINP